MRTGALFGDLLLGRLLFFFTCFGYLSVCFIRVGFVHNDDGLRFASPAQPGTGQFRVTEVKPADVPD